MSGLSGSQVDDGGESVDYVSPYSINNQTGYPIEIEMQYCKEKHYLGAYESLNFNIRDFKSGERGENNNYKINVRILF